VTRPVVTLGRPEAGPPSPIAPVDREGHGQEAAEATAGRLGDVGAGVVTGTVTAEATAGDGRKTGEGTAAMATTVVMGVTITVTMMTGGGEVTQVGTVTGAAVATTTTVTGATRSVRRPGPRS